MFPLFYHGTVDNSISFLFLKIRKQVEGFILRIAHPAQFLNGAVGQVPQLRFIGSQVAAHLGQRVDQALPGAGVVNAHKLLFFKGDGSHGQISLSALFLGAVFLCSCFGWL